MKKIFSLLFVIMISGCVYNNQNKQVTEISLKTNPVLHILNATELTEHINHYTNALKSIQAHGIISITEPNYEPMTCQIKIIFSNPNSIYIKGYKTLIPTLFKLISHEMRFYFFIPNENIIFTGENYILSQKKDYNISITPEHVLQAIKPVLINTQCPVELKSTSENYQLSVFSTNNNQSLMRTLTINKTTLNCINEKYYAPKGYQILEITRKNFTKDAQNYPSEIIIFNTIKRTKITLELEKVSFNKEVDVKDFEFIFPKGVDVEEIV